MIIKGQARGRATQLAAHLLSADQNESIRLYECRGTLARDVKGALIEMEARGLAARSKRPLYHSSISPEQTSPLSEPQIRQAVDHLEHRLGLHGQPRIVVVHRKKDREHIHIVWSRINAEDGTAISYSWNYRLHERAARELEATFGHRPVANSGGTKGRRISRRPVADYEQRQAERSGIPSNAVTAEVTALWNASNNGTEFKRRLHEAGYVLARGDRRVFVIIDQAGNVHSLARRIDGIDTHALRDQMRSIDLNALPSVATIRETQVKERVVGNRRRKFALASREVTHDGPRTPIHRAVRVAGANLAAVTALDGSNGDRTSGVRGNQKPKGSAFLYRSARAALFAEYARRLAAARQHLSGDQLVAAVAALEAERNAALDVLRHSHSSNSAGGKQHRRYRRMVRRVPRPRKIKVL